MRQECERAHVEIDQPQDIAGGMCMKRASQPDPRIVDEHVRIGAV